MDLERFVRHFGFKVVNIKQNYDYQRVSRYDSYSSSYYTDREQGIIELEIGRRELEQMADYFARMEELGKRDHEDFILRRDNPGLQDAYKKYQMLLELYK